jgi:hypothetical protein
MQLPPYVALILYQLEEACHSGYSLSLRSRRTSLALKTSYHLNDEAKQTSDRPVCFTASLLFVYKQEYPDPEECIQMVLEGVQEECQKIQEGMVRLKQIHADIDAACEESQTVCELTPP